MRPHSGSSWGTRHSSPPKSRSEKGSLEILGETSFNIIYTILEFFSASFCWVAIGKNHLHCWRRHAHMALFETEGPQSSHEKYRKHGEDEVLSHCMEQGFPAVPLHFQTSPCDKTHRCPGFPRQPRCPWGATTL